jgi:hypothetical protein
MKKDCDTLDYKIDCENKTITVNNLFCNDVNRPDIKAICKEECETGYVKVDGRCVQCDGNR